MYSRTCSSFSLSRISISRPYHIYPQWLHLNCALPSTLSAPKTAPLTAREAIPSLVMSVEPQVGQRGVVGALLPGIILYQDIAME